MLICITLRGPFYRWVLGHSFYKATVKPCTVRIDPYRHSHSLSSSDGRSTKILWILWMIVYHYIIWMTTNTTLHTFFLSDAMTRQQYCRRHFRYSFGIWHHPSEPLLETMLPCCKQDPRKTFRNTLIWLASHIEWNKNVRNYILSDNINKRTCDLNIDMWFRTQRYVLGFIVSH